jgi:hypothetical protein
VARSGRNGRRWGFEAFTAAVSAGVLGAVVIAGNAGSAVSSPAVAEGTVVAQIVIPSEPPSPAAKRLSGEHTDLKAAGYFKERWGADKAANRITDIRTIGGYLRIYTDLPESAADSAKAITLCERGLAYLKETGVAKPVVFVQAEPGENGSPVLANILGPGDRTCKVTHPEPQ